MNASLQDRFREVEAIPTPWDQRAHASPLPTPAPAPPRFALAAVAAAIAAVAAVTIVVGSIVDRDDATPRANASWLVADGAGSCVERYSVETLATRGYAFEGVIADVAEPSDPTSADPEEQTTTVTFDVERWFWGGSGPSAERRTYAFASSAGALDASIGARLLVAGDEDFIWSCGFTQSATGSARSDFEAAAARRTP